jgi:MFS family permease
MGGILTSAGGWRWIFLVNVPVCVLAVVTALVVVPAARVVPSAQRINLLSGLLITAGLASLIIGLGELQSRGPVLVPVLTLVASVVLVGLFVVRQARGDDPLLPLGLFRSRTAFAFVFVVVTAGAGIGAYFTSSLFMQETLGWSALQAGLAFVPWAALGAVVAQVVSRNVERVGPRVLVPAALGVTALGAAVLALGLSPSTTYAGGMLLPFLLLGLGTGAAGVSCTVTAMSGIPRHRHGVGAGVLNSTQAIGSALAIAVVVLFSSTWTERALARGAPAAGSQLAGQQFALLVMAGFALAGAVLAAVVLPWRVPVPVDKDEDVALSRPASAPLA